MKLFERAAKYVGDCEHVAFTPKGGCPLKLCDSGSATLIRRSRSIHPQGWVPIETRRFISILLVKLLVAFTPKGGCPLKLVPNIAEIRLFLLCDPLRQSAELFHASLF